MILTKTQISQLLSALAPTYAAYPITDVLQQGHDHRTYRLGTEFTLRLPSAAEYAAQIAKEAHYLPQLKGQVANRIPEPVFMGAPSEHFPYPFIVHRWIEGDRVNRTLNIDPTLFINAVVDFIKAFQAASLSPHLAPGDHNFYRGSTLEVYASEVDAAFNALAHLPRRSLFQTLWKKALAHPYHGQALPVHGDFEVSNLLWTPDHRLAVIDFGGFAHGDPACDYVMAWTYMDKHERADFFKLLNLDEGTQKRAAGWALWKALITLANPSFSESHPHAKKTLDALAEWI